VKKIASLILGFLAVGFLASAIVTNDKASEVSGELVIFHAGSLAVPFKKISDEFISHYPNVKIFREAAGSRVCARKITDLHRSCDVIACSDYTVIDSLLIPEHTEWNIKFASNEMVIAFRVDSRKADEINKDNWFDILVERDVAFGRSDPNADPCGYRAVFVMMLAEKFYGRPGLVAEFLAKDRRYIRPKEVDLLALLEACELDYIFIYRSVAEQHKLKYITLPSEVNLKREEFADFYKTVSVRITGESPETVITKVAGPIVYGVTIPKNAPNRKLALAFLDFLFDADKGGAILERNGQAFLVPSPTETFSKIPDGLKSFALPIEKGQK
jgi:molybdate/tungstate transport system substrate-binding protein